ncbi:NUDIX domain-containing protein [Tissierella sp.]|uniref:NUDIX domain-containing protein n=1 Tax=Tissierella sp. TaxID=41274 RepID=UPI00305550B5
MNVTFYSKNEVNDKGMKFAVIISKSDDKWVLCKHGERDTWKIPGGTRETGESIDQTVKRELYEEWVLFI